MFNTICILIFASSGPSSVEGERTDIIYQLTNQLLSGIKAFPQERLTITTLFPRARLALMITVHIIPGLMNILLSQLVSKVMRRKVSIASTCTHAVKVT